MLPDADVLGFAFGVRYGDLLGHRGFTHSLLFALLLGCFVTSAFFRDVPRFSRAWWSLALLFAAATASHGILDAFTDGGLGVAFFSPFDPTRYFFPWQPIPVSPIGPGFFTSRGAHVLAGELFWVWLPSFVVVAAVNVYRRRRFG
jgi:inner membrane protein